MLYRTSIPTSHFLSTTPSAANDRGVMHQLLVDLGVSSDTAHTVQVWAVPPIRILIILLVAWVVTRLERRYSLRIVHSLRAAPPLIQPSSRALSRGTTIAGVISAVIRGVIWVIAGLAILSELGINLGAFVAGATVIGAALGFGAQTLVKDFLSGMLILAEDQYGVGDTIAVNNTTGTVEGMTLRITRIRSIDGVIWYVPNGDIRTVGNNSEGDSVALVEVVVPLGTDLAAAGRVIEDEACRMAGEAEWSSVIVGEPTFAGIPAVTNDGATLRVMVRTIPGEHMRATRELRLRFLERLRKDHVAWAPAETSNGAAAAEEGGTPAELGAAPEVDPPDDGGPPPEDGAPAPGDRGFGDGAHGGGAPAESEETPPTPRASTTPPRRLRLPRRGR